MGLSMIERFYYIGLDAGDSKHTAVSIRSEDQESVDCHRLQLNACSRCGMARTVRIDLCTNLAYRLVRRKAANELGQCFSLSYLVPFNF